MKLLAIKFLVYHQAQVTTPQQLKAKYSGLQGLDFRLKKSWLTALNLTATEPITYAAWAANPPAEYQELFAAMAHSQQTFAEHFQNATTLTQDLEKLADHLETQALHLSTEATTAAQNLQKRRRLRAQAQRN